MSNAGGSEVNAMTIIYTRLELHEVLNGQMSCYLAAMMRKEGIAAIDPFQDALPCWDESMAIQRRLIDWENMGKLKPSRNPLECL